jgi:CBS domain-containing protein
MSREVKVIPQDMPLPAAARLLCEAHISGAPVVDNDGRCIGVLSATDFVHRARDEGSRAAPGLPQPGFCSDWQMVDVDRLPEDQVRRHMTPGPVTVSPTEPVTEVARIMLEAHIHRVVVVDLMRRPVGVVTSTDLLAVLAATGQTGRGSALPAACTAVTTGSSSGSGGSASSLPEFCRSRSMST